MSIKDNVKIINKQLFCIIDSTTWKKKLKNKTKKKKLFNNSSS